VFPFDLTPSILSEISGFRTLSIVLVLKRQTKEKHDVSELFPSSGEGKTYSVGSL
jgi:hypothetical protein